MTSMRTALFPLTTLLLIGAVVLPAQAEEACKNAPKDQWLSADAIKSKVEGMGLTVRQVKEDDGCWEVYGLTRDGKKAELHLEPTTGAVVEQDVDD
jgi:hypothetical protein